MQRLPQFLVYSVVNSAEVNHYFFFRLASERTELFYGFQEERAALFAGVKFSEEEEEGVELFCQCRGEFKRKHACGHMQNGPSHGAQFFLTDCKSPLFCWCLVLGGLQLSDVLIESAIEYDVLGDVIPIVGDADGKKDKHQDSNESVFASSFDQFHPGVVNLIRLPKSRFLQHFRPHHYKISLENQISAFLVLVQDYSALQVQRSDWLPVVLDASDQVLPRLELAGQVRGEGPDQVESVFSRQQGSRVFVQFDLFLQLVVLLLAKIGRVRHNDLAVLDQMQVLQHVSHDQS